MASVTLHEGEDSEAEVVNIQPGLVVTRVQSAIKYERFDHDGFKMLGISLLNKQSERLKTILEQQTALNNDLKLYNSQSI